MNKVAIIGAGGHARVLAEIIELTNDMQLVGFFDDNTAAGTIITRGYPCLGASSEIENYINEIDAFVIGIGNNEVRQKLHTVYPDLNWQTLIHPKATCSSSSFVGKGTVVLAGAVVAANTVIGDHVIVNSNVVVDHDCVVNSFVHLSIGSLIGSNTEVAAKSVVSIGQIVPSFSKI